MSAEVRRLRIGVVGAGRVAQVCHLPWLMSERERYDLVAFADPAAAVRERVSRDLGVPAVPDLRAVLDLEPDAIVCCSPIGTHREIVAIALAAGVHVLCEKPLTLSTADCDTLLRARDRANCVVQVGYMKRFDPAFQRLLELLPRSVSDILYVSVEIADAYDAPFTVALKPTRPEARDRMWEDVHRLEEDQVRQAVGEDLAPDAYMAYRHGYFASLIHDVNLLFAVVQKMGVVDELEPSDATFWAEGAAVQLGVELDGGGRANLVHFRSPGVPFYRETVSVYCRDRLLELSFNSPYLSRRPARLVVRRGDETLALQETSYDAGYDDAFRRQLLHFHEAVLGFVEPANTLEEARRDMQLLERAHSLAVRSKARGKQVASSRRIQT